MRSTRRNLLQKVHPILFGLRRARCNWWKSCTNPLFAVNVGPKTVVGPTSSLRGIVVPPSDQQVWDAPCCRQMLERRMRKHLQSSNSPITTSPIRDLRMRLVGTYRIHQSGILSCFFGGFSTLFDFSAASARQTRLRVDCGMITSSTKPRSAATKGF